MRFKITKDLCYMAGLAGRTREPEKSMVGIRTTNDEMVERFIKEAITLGVDTKKIMVEENESNKHIYFFHSKLARMIQEVLRQRQSLPKKGRELAVAFLAGTFDASGHVTNDKIIINRLEKSDELLLELMDIHTVSYKILNIKRFLDLIKKESTFAKNVNLN